MRKNRRVLMNTENPEYVDGVDQPMEAHQVRDEAREPPGEDGAAQAFAHGNPRKAGQKLSKRQETKIGREGSG